MINTKNINNSRRLAINGCGFSLVELIIVIFIFSVALMAILALITRSLTATSAVKSELVAGNLAAEGIEVIRNIRDTNWLQGFEWSDLNRDGINNEANKTCDTGALIYADPSFDSARLRSPLVPGQCDEGDNPNNIRKDLYLVKFNAPLNQKFYVPGSSTDYSDSKCTESDSETTVYDPTQSKATPFDRYMTICFDQDADSVTFMRVKSIVAWGERGRTHTIELEDHLYDWK